MPPSPKDIELHDDDEIVAGYSSAMYGGAPDECSWCWPHKIHDDKPCADCKDNDLGCAARL